jgi:uncharacterized protein (DUF2141 family)
MIPLALLTVALGLAAGCQTPGETGAFPPQNTTKFDLENKANFVLMDAATQKSVTCSGLAVQPMEDGRLKVTANVRNREARRIQVQVNCVFKDANGFPTGDETPFQNLILTENAQEGVTFMSMNNQAQKYTIRVRQAH